MNYQVEILPPSPVFKPYIEYYKNVITDASGTFKCIPNTRGELYFNYKEMHLQSGTRYSIENAEVYFAGLHAYEQNSFSTIGAGVSGGFVIVFKPDGIQNLFRLSNAEIFGYAVEGENIFKSWSEKLWLELKDIRCTAGKIAKVESFLSRFLRTDFYPDSFVNHVLKLIELKKGKLSAGEICKFFNISPRSLQRKFRDKVGMSPKEYLQIVRLNYALKLIQSPGKNSLTRLSYLSGYYDQSHFIRDIVRICGFPPGVFKKEIQRLEQCDNRNFLKLS